MKFTVQIQLKKPDGTTVYNNKNYTGLFDAQSKALTMFERMVKSLKPEALENEAFCIVVLREFEVIEKFESKRWINEGCI